MRFWTCPTVLEKNHAPAANIVSPATTNDRRLVAT
jgi:hypothetical protein